MSLPRPLVLLLLLLLPCALFPGALPGPRVVSADEHLSVHHIRRTASGPGGWVANPQLSDPAVQFRPLRDRVRTAWAAGRPPLWNPDLFAGTPLLADGLSAACYPPVVLELLVPPAVAEDLRAWLHLSLAGTGTATLAWLLGASPAGGLLAGTAAMLGGWPVGRLLHPHAWVYAWIPWLAWALCRLGRGRGLVPVTLVFAAMLLAGHPQTAVHGLLFALGVAACGVRGRRAWAGAVLGLALGALLAAPALLPFADELLRSETVHTRTGNHLPWAALLTLGWPDPFGHPARGDWHGPGAHLELNLHVGVVTLALCAWGLRARVGRLWVGGAALALAVALGLPLLAWVPANHARLGGVATLCLALGAGMALPRRRWAWALCALTVAELVWARRDDQGTLAPQDFRAPPAAWTQAVGRRVAGARIAGLGWAIQPDTGMIAGFRDVRGYELPVSRETERLMAAFDPGLRRPWYPIAALTPANRALLAFAAVRLLAVVPGDEAAEASVADLAEIAGLDAPLRFFELDPGAPRAWVAYGAARAADADGALRAVSDAAAARRSPPVEATSAPDVALGSLWARPDPPPPDPLVLAEPWPERIEARTASTDPALLVVTEAWAPGWRAEVDGESARIVRVAGAFLGTALPPGPHEVVFTYQPRGWTWGLLLAVLGALGVLAAALWSWVSKIVGNRRGCVDASTVR